VPLTVDYLADDQRLNEQIEKLNLGSEGEASKLQELQTLLERRGEEMNVSWRTYSGGRS
jgi:hypothetical protein